MVRNEKGEYDHHKENQKKVILRTKVEGLESCAKCGHGRTPSAEFCSHPQSVATFFVVVIGGQWLSQ